MGVAIRSPDRYVVLRLPASLVERRLNEAVALVWKARPVEGVVNNVGLSSFGV